MICFLFTSNHCIFVSFDRRTNIMLYVFVTVPSCDVITIGTVIVPSSNGNFMFWVAFPVSSSVSPIFMLAYSFAEITLIVAKSFSFGIEIILVGTESLSTNLSIMSVLST